ncbi:MAG: galactose oxidase-like domain-containing protein [Pseudonocardia sp.]
MTATLAVSGVGVASAPGALAAEEPDPASVGAWSAPFEEGGSDTPRCEIVYDPADANDASPERLECKPTAVTSAVLPDGRVLYGNGIESEENAEEGVALSLAPESRADRTRTLDLRDGLPTFDIPENETTDGDNPTIVSGRTSDSCLTEAPLGVAGVPGRGGDGLVGSVVSQTGVETEPTCAPDDVQDNDGNIFCGDIVQMADGRQMIMGGTDWYNEPSLLEQAEGDPANVGVVELEGLRSARIFDHTAGEDGLGRWDATGAMKFGRWYPSGLTLPDGRIAVVSGTVKLIKSTQGSQVRRTETYDPETAQWSENFTGLASEKTLPQNARVYLAPDGRLFYTGDGQMFGPFGQAVDEALFADQGFFDFETNEWSSAGITIPRSSPASVALPMKVDPDTGRYDSMTILRAGGTLGPPPGSYVAVPTTELTTITADGDVTNVAGPELNNARWFTQPTPLPTGEVLLTSGARNDEVVLPGAELPVAQPEIYDPETNKFFTLASPERDRTYHNNAVLLPNGQVLVGGNSPISLGYGVQRDAIPGFTGNNDKDPSFEVFSPPYLFRGDRPAISDVQAGLAWGENFSVITDDASDIQKITLMRMPAPQHVMDNDTRTLELPFSQTGSRSLAVDMPQDGIAAPPGYYYLFINRTVVGNDTAFVPSVARIVKVGDTSDKSPALEPMSEDTVIEGAGASPVEANTLLNNPPNPLDTPTVPGETDPNGVPDPADLLLAPEAPVVPAPDPAATPEAPENPTGEFPAGDAAPPAATLPALPSGSAGRRAQRPDLR